MYRFSKSIMNTPRSYVREILKMIGIPGMISFAGGLPNNKFFPVEALAESADRVLSKNGSAALQYSATEGYVPLREFISARYKGRGLNIPIEEILIVGGSQQAIDLVGRVFFDEGDALVLEEPGYLGAIQAFAQYMPSFKGVTLENDGIDTAMLEKKIGLYNPKLFYAVPNFQNPTGLTYSLAKRQKTGEIIERTKTVMLEDDPYGELRFIGEHLPPLKCFAPEYGMIQGSFSKIVAPGFRLGWIAAPAPIMEKLVTAKQAADLHTNQFSQLVLADYFANNDLNAHIEKIKKGYYEQRAAMVDALAEYFPDSVKYTEPEGGMFLWATLPEGYAAMELAGIALNNKVGFVPGEPFYTDGRTSNAMRLNYTASDPQTIREGVKRLAESITEYLKTK